MTAAGEELVDALLRRLTAQVGASVCPRCARDGGAIVPLHALEKAEIERALLRYHGDVEQSYRALGISRSTFYRRLTKHGIRLEWVRRRRSRPRRSGDALDTRPVRLDGNGDIVYSA